MRGGRFGSQMIGRFFFLVYQNNNTSLNIYCVSFFLCQPEQFFFPVIITSSTGFSVKKLYQFRLILDKMHNRNKNWKPLIRFGQKFVILSYWWLRWKQSLLIVLLSSWQDVLEPNCRRGPIQKQRPGNIVNVKIARQFARIKFLFNKDNKKNNKHACW